jgi:hypothetical protein
MKFANSTLTANRGDHPSSIINGGGKPTTENEGNYTTYVDATERFRTCYSGSCPALPAIRHWRPDRPNSPSTSAQSVDCRARSQSTTTTGSIPELVSNVPGDTMGKRFSAACWVLAHP